MNFEQILIELSWQHDWAHDLTPAPAEEHGHIHYPSDRHLFVLRREEGVHTWKPSDWQVNHKQQHEGKWNMNGSLQEKDDIVGASSVPRPAFMPDRVPQGEDAGT